MSFAPTDLRYGQNIIDNYLRTIQSQQAQQQLDLETKKLEQQHEIESKQLGLAQSAQEFKQTMEKHGLAQKYLELAQTGTPPPGGSIEQPALSSPVPRSGMQPISQTLGLGTNEQRVNFPPELGIPSTVTLNPQKAAELRGKIGLEEIKPKELLALATEQAKGQDALNREFLSLQQKTLQDEKDRASREAIAREETSRTLAAARLTQVGELQRSVLNRASTSFDTHPIVRDYNTLKLANETAQGDPSDLELLTAYHKSLNPGQAATPEYAITLPQTLPSFATRLGLKLDNITNPKDFIDQKTRDDLKKQIQNRFKLQESAYKNFRASEASKLQQVGIDKPEQFLTDYSKSTPLGPKVGDEKKFPNGKIGVWDGTGYVDKATIK